MDNCGLKTTIASFALFCMLWLGFKVDTQGKNPSLAGGCSKPAVRREWRTLKPEEQRSYLSAVVCLANTPSTSNSIGTIYDDFAWVHMQIGAYGREK
jgi:hypothetical protein